MSGLKISLILLILTSLQLVSSWYWNVCNDYECTQGTCVQIFSTTVRSCGDYHDELRKKRQVDRYIYRVLRNDEDPSNGLTAKDPQQTKSIQSHVGCGSRSGYQSQFISCTADYQAAVDWARGRRRRVVQIDTHELMRQGIPIHNLSDADASVLPGVTARNFAQRYREVLVEVSIPANAIVDSWFIDNNGDPARRCHM